SVVKADVDTKDVKISEGEVSSFMATEKGKEQTLKYYTDNNDRYKQEEQVRARHILVKTEETDTDEVRAMKRKKLEILLPKLTPGNFADYAKKESDDKGSAVSGGDLGFFGRGRMVKPFEEKAFSMKKGTISDIVETRFGYHVILVEDKKEASVTPFEKVKSRIARQLLTEKKQLALAGARIDGALKAGGIFEAAKLLGSRVEETGKISMKSSGIPKIAGSTVNDVLWSFTLEKGKIYKRNFSGDNYLVTLKYREGANVDSRKLDEFGKTYISDRGNLEFQRYSDTLRKEWSDKVVFSRAMRAFVQKE
ncbi:MAG: peptidylprolyl isomerase, partial [Oligoflexia bacterium]|nr:peptidylprolyl isomerase [Oligoflexia bacterium]